MTISTQSFLSINVGSSANDGTGDDLRTAFQKVNANFGWIGNTGFSAANISATTIEATLANITTLTQVNTTGNVLAVNGVFNSLSSNGNITVVGNLIRTGGTIDSGYQYYAPSANTAITANVNVSRVILDPTADAYGIVFTLPAGNVDAKVVTLSSTANIAGLQPVGSIGTTVVPTVNIAIPKGTAIQFFYHASEGKWYKIG